MCGRYYIATEDAGAEIRALIDEINRREREKPDGMEVKTGDIYPTDIALVVANNRNLQPRPFLMRWGFDMGTGKKPLINARSETALEKPLFRNLARARRLLVPASGYYEWEKRDGKRAKYSIDTDGALAWMAGLYRPRESGEMADFVILTREAAPSIRFIHSRMPVIFARDAARAWLDTACDPARVLTDAREDVRYRRAEEAVGGQSIDA